MTTALALVSPTELSNAGAPPTIPEIEPPAPSRARTTSSPFVYGDATPFPHDWDCIGAIKDSVECAVDLLRVQHLLVRGRAREVEIERRLGQERTRLHVLAESVERAVAPSATQASEPVARTVSRIIAAARQSVDAEIAALEAATQTELTQLRDGMFKARSHAARALQVLLARHDFPGTRTGFRLVANDLGYHAETLLSTPFGVNAIFELSIPQESAWTRRRRVAELGPDMFVSVPREAGWFSKRVEMTRLPLDKLYILAASGDGDRGMVILGRGPRAGAGYELEIDASQDPPHVVLAELGDDGAELSPKPLILQGEDRGRALQLWRRLQESLVDVLPKRTSLASATFDGRPIEAEEPHNVAKRMLDMLAPIATEVGRRSGSSGELVLRKTIGNGRRDEIYVTKAELLERVLTLPPNLRSVFDGLELDGPRSPRAPSPSRASFEEISAELVGD